MLKSQTIFLNLIVSIQIFLGNFTSCQQSAKSASLDSSATILYQTHCLMNVTTQIKIQCPNDQRIKIIKTVFGYNVGYSFKLFKSSLSSQNICSYSVADCVYEKDSSIEEECNSKTYCTKKINKNSFNFHHKCSDYNYVQINYKCMPVLKKYGMCEHTDSKFTNAYIITPNYPNAIDMQLNCECELTSSSQILVKLLDMKISQEENNCKYSYLETRENAHSSGRFCGYIKETKPILGSGSYRLKLSFSANDSASLPNEFKTRGFWLQIWSSPLNQNIEIKCNRDKSNTTPNVDLDKDLNMMLKELQILLKRTFSEKILKNILFNSNDEMTKNMKEIVNQITTNQLNEHQTSQLKLDLAINAIRNELDKQENKTIGSFSKGLNEKHWQTILDSIKSGFNLDESFKSIESTTSTDDQTHNNIKLQSISSSVKSSKKRQHRRKTEKKNDDLIRRIIRNSIKINKTIASSLNSNSTGILSCDTSVTRFPVFYNSFEKLDCNDTVVNASLLKCIDSLLEWKLARKLSFFYDIQLQPVFIFKNKLNCIPMYNSDMVKKYRCNLIAKTLLNKKKVVWKLTFKIKNQICIPELNMIMTSPVSQPGQNKTTQAYSDFNNSTANITDQIKFILKKAPNQTVSKINEFSIESLLSNKLVLITIGSFSMVIIMMSNLLLFFVFKITKSKNPLSNLTASMSNRLLQNYLNLSVSSKKSFNKQINAEEKSDKISSNKSELNSCLEINRIPSGKKKVKYSVSTVATQADMNQNSVIAERIDFMYRNQERSDVESQILSIEVFDFFNEQSGSSNDFLNKPVLRNEKACAVINEYAAFRNSINMTNNHDLTNNLFDLYDTSYTSSLHCKSISDIHNTLVLKFSKNITDEHLKLDCDSRKFSNSNQTTSTSTIVPFDLNDGIEFTDNDNKRDTFDCSIQANMVFRAALINNSNQSIISNYVHNREILDKSVYEFLHTLPYLNAADTSLKSESRAQRSQLSKSIDDLKSEQDTENDTLNDKSLKSISSHELYSNAGETQQTSFSINIATRSVQTLNRFTLNASRFFRKEFSKSLADLSF